MNEDHQANLLAVEALVPPTEGHQRDPSGRASFSAEVMRAAGVTPDDLPAEIPGLRIAFDADRGSLRITDPLAELPDADRLALFGVFAAAYQRHLRVESDYVENGMMPARVAEWQGWLDAASAPDGEGNPAGGVIEVRRVALRDVPPQEISRVDVDEVSHAPEVAHAEVVEEVAGAHTTEPTAETAVQEK